MRGIINWGTAIDSVTRSCWTIAMKPFALPLALAMTTGWPATGADPRPGQTEFKLLDGTWRIISSERDGVEQPPAQLPQRWRLTFRAGDFERGDGPRGSIARIDTTAKPKEIDYRLAGTAKDVLGIYVLEGDLFIECTAVPGGGRPKSFASAMRSGHTLVIYKRVKKKTDELPLGFILVAATSTTAIPTPPPPPPYGGFVVADANHPPGGQSVELEIKLGSTLEDAPEIWYWGP